MLKRDAFGQIIQFRSPRLRFITEDEQKAADTKAAEKAEADRLAAEKSQEAGFPAGTPLEQMTMEQREAYWKHQARKHESTVKARSDYDDLKAKAAKYEELEAQNVSEQEKAIREAAETARMEGENIGAERYLKDAVKANFRAITGLSKEDVDKAFGHVDAKSFIGSDGEIDQTALDEFAGTFGTKATAQQSINPVRAALGAQQSAGGSGGGAGSVEDVKRQRAEALAARK